jgi:transcriptional regulator with PAS, ATPase and Fis domain
MAEKAAGSNIPVLVAGESGVGKELIARAIHGSGERRMKPFVAVNCGAMPENLIESILFGHEKGSFTGAASRHLGKFEQAHGGTLFLDEIGDMPPALQARLLNVIEDREVLPPGAAKAVNLDVRIVSATQYDPLEMIAAGRLRGDLYYRLNGISLRLPALRERTDLAALVAKLIEKEAGAPIEVEPALLERLAHHTWPGNIRQLRNLLRTMVVLRGHERLTLADLKEEWLAGPQHASSLAGAAEGSDCANGESALCGAEREALRRMLESCEWNVSAAAARLHISRRTIYRKIHRHGLLRHAGLLAARMQESD